MPKPKPEADPPAVDNGRIDRRVAEFIVCRDEIEAIKERHRQELKPYEELKNKLIGTMLDFLDRTGQKSAKTANGIATVTVRHTAVCTDPDRFIDFVREHDLFELMDRRANAVACRDYAEEHDGVLPPGVKINSIRTVGVTRA